MNGNWTDKTDLAADLDDETADPEQGTPPLDEAVARPDSLPPQAQSAAPGAIMYVTDRGQISSDNAEPGGIIERNIIDSPAAAPQSRGNLKVAAELQDVVDQMRNKSKAFNDLATELDASERPYKLRYEKLAPKTPANTLCYPLVKEGCVTLIDPDQIAKTRYVTEKNEEARMTLQRAIAHELSHSINYDHGPFSNAFEPHSTMIDYENRIMNEIDPASPNRNRNNDSVPQDP